MEKEEIIEVLAGWNFWRNTHETGIYREKYLRKLDMLIKTEQIVVITGARRSGKSTLMKQFIKTQLNSGEKSESFLYVNFEESRFAGLLSLDFLHKIYESYLEIVKPAGVPFLLLDEIHNVPNWEKFVRSLHEKKEANIIVSGSTSKLLSKELGVVLTGRWVGLETFPLDFFEFLGFHGMKLENKLDLVSKKIKLKQMLREYLEYGGFPLVVLKEGKEELLERYFNDIVGKDVAERHRVRSVIKLKALAKYYLTSFSSLVSYRKITKVVDLSLDSVERFSGFMADAYLIFFVHKFSYSFKEQVVNPRKVYCIDSGLINALSFRFSENIGRLYENQVFLSLVKRGEEIFYYAGKRECDFVLMKGKKIVLAIQVSYKLGANKEREVLGLLEAMDFFKLKTGLIITEDYEGKEQKAGKTIEYKPLWKWLLEK
jgi:uncharacterized protein